MSATDDLLSAARALAWWSHCNLSSPDIYQARRASFARLRDVLAETFHADVSIELAFVIRAARRLAACSDSNRWGLPYYERKEAFAQLRGALDVYDRCSTGRPVPQWVPSLTVAAGAKADSRSMPPGVDTAARSRRSTAGLATG